MPKNMRPLHGRAASIISPIFIAALLLCSCTSGGRNSAETAPPTAGPSAATPLQAGAPAATPNANSQPAAQQPTLAEAQAAVARVYQQSVTVETGLAANPFVVGDFNNDGVEDIAVVVRPAKGALAELNSEYANWILEDVTKVQLPVAQGGRVVLPPKPEPVRVEQNDQLLAVVHGYKKEGWRNEQARQTYLLKNAVGDEMRSQPVKYALAGASTSNPHLSLNGDVIKETRGRQEGYIYWTGSKYAWRQ